MGPSPTQSLDAHTGTRDRGPPSAPDDGVLTRIGAGPSAPPRSLPDLDPAPEPERRHM